MENQLEIWRPVHDPRFSHAYEVSSHGQVRSLSRFIDRRGGSFMLKGRVLKKAITSGYYRVTLISESHKANYLVHRLVALAFLPPANVGEEVCHNDGDRLNCFLDNLRFGSRVENSADRDRHGVHFHGENCHFAIISEEDAFYVRALCLQGMTQKAVANIFGISRSAVGKIVCRKNWRHLDVLIRTRGGEFRCEPGLTYEERNPPSKP